MLRDNDDVLCILKYILNRLAAVLTKDAGGSTILLSARAVYFVTLHIRFSQLFYGSGLTLITGADVLAGRTLIVYTYLINCSEHIRLCTLTEKGCSVGSIEELFINATWYEREVSEFLGVKFMNSVDTRTLLMPYNNTTNPLKKIMPSNSTSTLGYSRLSESLKWFQI